MFNPPPPDEWDTFAKLFPPPVTEVEKARARRAAHAAAEAVSRVMAGPRW